MKITQNTPELLVIDDRPWLFGLIFIGFAGIFASIGAVMLYEGLWGGIFMFLIAGLIFTAFYFLIERTQLVIDASAGQLEIRKKSMHRMKRDRFDLKNLRRTTVETKTSFSNGTSKVISRLILVFDEGDGETGTPLTAALTSGGAAERISPVVNAWLEAAKA